LVQISLKNFLNKSDEDFQSAVLYLLEKILTYINGWQKSEFKCVNCFLFIERKACYL